MTETALLVANIDLLATPLGGGRWLERRGGVLLTEGGQLRFVGTANEYRRWLEANDPGTPRLLDASGCAVLPGFVNGHHHLYQSLTRTLGTAAGLPLFDWLRLLYPIWGRLTPEGVYTSAKLALAELILSGATTVADHLYLFPNSCRLDDEIAAAQEAGVRFHPTRGSMSLGEGQGGLPPDALVEDEDRILADCERLIGRYHDPAPHSMLRLGLAPCSPFSVTGDLMRVSADLARAHPGVRLHTHLAETADETDYCLGQFGKRPLEYADSLGWTGADVWFAHMVHPDLHEIDTLARTGCGVCHCPTSNMILASGIAPVRPMLDAGVRVGLGVDGSASNDGNQMLGEARLAMLLGRVKGKHAFSVRTALELATLGGAHILGRDDIGRLEPGLAADFVAFRLDDAAHAGALSDPLAALVTCQPVTAWFSVINGQVVVESGRFLPYALEPLITTHNAISQAMIAG